MISLIFVLTISGQTPSTGLLGGAPQGAPSGQASQREGPSYPTRAVNAIEGTWECSSGIETMGLYMSEFMMPSWNANPPHTIFIGIYRIRSGGVDEEFFYPGKDPATKVATNRNHLTIHFANEQGSKSRLSNIDLDITFDSGNQRWTGTGTLCNPSGMILLERPHSDNPLVGDWRDFFEGPEVPPFGKPLWIGSDFHIRQGTNGRLIVWKEELKGTTPKDVLLGSFDNMIWTMRMDTSWQIQNQPSNRFSLTYIPCGSCNNYDYTFEGSISNPSSRLITGTWFELNHGQKSEYSTSFHRLN